MDLRSRCSLHALGHQVSTGDRGCGAVHAKLALARGQGPKTYAAVELFQKTLVGRSRPSTWSGWTFVLASLRSKMHPFES